MSDELTVKDAGIKAEVVDAYHELLGKLKIGKKPEAKVEVISDVSRSAAASDMQDDETYYEYEQEAGADVQDAIAEQEYVLEEDKPQSYVDEYENEQERVIRAIADEAPEEYSRHLENLKSALVDTLDGLKERINAEQRRLATIMDAIDAKTRKIEELHKIEVNVDTLSALMMAHKEKTRQFEQEMNERRQAFEQELAQKRRDRQQEEMKYVYQRDLAREKEQSRYDAARREAEQEFADMRRKAERELEEREARVATREALNEKVAQFPEEMRIAVQKAKEATAKQLTSDFDYERQIVEKELKLREQTIATLESRIQNLESNITHFESLKKSFNRLLANDVSE